jgi:hypothetical protein
MALLRWVHLRKLVPLSELIQGLEKPASAPLRPAVPQQRPATPAPRPATGNAATAKAVETRREAVTDLQPVAPGNIKNAFLDEVRRAKKFFYGTVVAQAQRIDVELDRIVFVFAPQHRALRGQLDQTRVYLEDLAGRLAGRRMAVISAEGPPLPNSAETSPPSLGFGETGPPSLGFGETSPPSPGLAAKVAEPRPEKDRQADLKQQALADSGVQAMLDVFAAEIKEVEER